MEQSVECDSRLWSHMEDVSSKLCWAVCVADPDSTSGHVARSKSHFAIRRYFLEPGARSWAGIKHSPHTQVNEISHLSLSLSQK